MTDESDGKSIVFQARAPWWSEAVQRHGLSTVLLFVGGWLVYANIFLPLFTRQMNFIDAVQESVEKMVTISEEQKNVNIGVQTKLTEIDNGIDRLNAAESQNVKELQTLNESSKSNGAKLEAIEKKIGN